MAAEVDHVGIVNNEPSSSSSVGTPGVGVAFSPGGTREWIPSCSKELKPIVGMKFKDHGGRCIILYSLFNCFWFHC
ncbi:hypothetical protein SOVF_018350 isoform A [Spinacia oleracea]|nr:hypothetical protein SOVF_018350 isoform A [Spinacia oleracea]